MEKFEKNLDYYEQQLDVAIAEAKVALERRKRGEIIEDFDIRGKLYGYALELAADSRHEDIENMHAWINPQKNETTLEMASGTGFLTKNLSKWTGNTVYATDPAHEQIEAIDRLQLPHVKTMLCSPDNKEQMEKIPEQVDIATAFGGIHHVPNLRAMMENIADALKPGGRMVVGEVKKNSNLSRHFDEVVAIKSITGHTAQWYDDDVLQELIKDLPLRIVKTEDIPLKWYFDSERHMALFFKGLHAYDLSLEEINADLQAALGWQHKDGKVVLNWPMYFFHIEKK